MPETTKLFGSTKSKITTDENGEIVSHLEKLLKYNSGQNIWEKF